MEIVREAVRTAVLEHQDELVDSTTIDSVRTRTEEILGRNFLLDDPLPVAAAVEAAIALEIWRVKQ